MKKGDTIELEIKKYAFEGKGIAKINRDQIKPDPRMEKKEAKNNYVIFVGGAYPGDRVKASLRKIKKNYAEAKTEEIIFPSKDRIDPECKFFGTCGGCRQQDLDYKLQTRYKQQQVEEIFNQMGGFSNYKVEDIVPSENIFYYRNKMEFSFGNKRWLTNDEINSNENIERDFALGLHIPRNYDKVLDVDECFLQSEVSNQILNFTRKFFKQRKIKPYSTEDHQGYLRNLVIKQSQHTDDLMVNLVTANEDDLLMKQYTEKLLDEIPQITTIINNINLKKAAVAVGDYEKLFHGSGFIYDKIRRYNFRISANSFFQTNTIQAERLYQTAADFAEFKGDEIVYDLYSGAGTIAIYISEKAKSVFCFENSESAVADAEENKKLNDISNVEFFNADLYKSFLPVVEENNLPKPEVVILDPPRGGMHKNTVDDVLKLSPDKIVYVSCNPTTQVRDIKLLSEGGYNLIKIRPVDMFPHTYHIENVALLRKN